MKENPKLDALFDELRSNLSNAPGCFIINQIGENFIETHDERAENFFAKLLDSSGEQERLCAFGYLSLVKGLKKTTLKKIEEFKKNSENTHIIKLAKQQMAALQAN